MSYIQELLARKVSIERIYLSLDWSWLLVSNVRKIARYQRNNFLTYDECLQFANIPPSVIILVPVILLALSLSKYTTESAISSAPLIKESSN